MLAREAPRLSLIEVARYGSIEGDAAMARIEAVAASEHYLVVADQLSCELIVFERATQKVLRRFGSCGDGPGEYRDFVSLNFSGNALLVVDGRGRRARLISLDGAELRQVDLRTAGPPVGVGFRSAALLDDGSVVIGADLPAHPRPGRGPSQRPSASRYINVVPGRTGAAAYAFLEDGAAVARHSHSEIRGVASCVMNGGAASPPRVVAMNEWVPQFVSVPLTDSLVPELNLLIDDVPLRPEPTPQDPARLTHPGLVDGACGDSVALFALRLWARDTASRFPDEAHVVAVWPGSGQYAVAKLQSEREALIGRVSAGQGESFFVVHNDRFDYPMVLEVRVSRGEPAESASRGEM